MSYFDSPIVVVCGPMRSGKSRHLLMEIDRLKYSKIPYLIFKPDIDSRDKGVLTTRYLKHSEQAILIRGSSPREILKHVDPGGVDVPFYVIIDEAQFFSRELVDVVVELNSKGIGFIIGGLDLDANGKTFGPLGDLLALATSVIKVKAVCEKCLNVSHRSALKVVDPDFFKNNIKVGDSDFEVLCMKCFYQKFAKV